MSLNPHQTSGLGIGKCYRLLYPKLVGTVLTFGQKFKPGPIKNFPAAKLTESILKKFKFKKASPEQIKLISETCNVDSNVSIPILYLKIVFIGAAKLGKYSKYRVVRVKDHSGYGHFATLYGRCSEGLEIGKIYKCVALMATSYKGENELYGRLKSQAATKIIKAGADVSALFDHVMLGDLVLNRTIISHEEPHIYECCEQCKRKGHKSEPRTKCIFCGEEINPTLVFHDFNVILAILDDNTSDIKRVSVFRKDLGVEFNSFTSDNINEKLIPLHMKRITIEADTDDIAGVLKAVKVNLTN